MMDRNYPTSSFADPLAPPAQTAAWAYERSTACIKPSSSYGATHLESELLHRQTYASSHQLPTYTTTHHPTGLSGAFDTSLHTTGSNATETSVMNFLSAIESRGLQAGPASASLLPQFRTPSWQTGANSSSTELFLTGALSSSGTFSTPAALSSYQHPSAFPSRSFTTTPSLALQDATFTSSNGLLSPNDPLLQIKVSQGTVPTALAFDRLGGTLLGAGLPPQSSTYRSAQESAPHLLQPQFSLLSSTLGASQHAPQPYGVPVFSGSIERALQRECSVIKHHQRPSSTQSVQEQLPGSTQHSLQGYLAGDNNVSFQQDPSRQAPVPCSPTGDSAHAMNGGAQQKTASQATLQQTQAYSSSIPSPGFSSSSGVKGKDCSSKISQHPSERAESQTGSPDLQQQSYPSPAQKQSSVIASQSQPYTTAQLPSLMSISPSQTYITSQSLPSSISHSQAFSTSQTEKLPSIYKTLSSFASQSENETSVSQSLVYSSSQQQGLSLTAHGEQYEAQVQGLCMGNPSQNYSSSHSQGLPNVSYYAQGPATTSSSQSYATGQSLTPTLSFSSTRAHNLTTSNSNQDYILMQPSPGSKTEGVLLQQPQKYLLSVQSPTTSTATHAQALQNNRSSAELKPAYGKRKLDGSVFLTSKEGCGELPIQDVQALQQASLGASTQTLAGGEMGAQNNVVYVVSKMEDRHNTQSVIRSNSRSEDQIMGLAHMAPIKDERIGSLSQHVQLMTSGNARVTPDPKKNSTLMQSSHMPLSAEELKQHSLLLKAPGSQQQNHQTHAIRIQPQDHSQASQGQTQFIRVPGGQVLLEPSQMILLQQPLLHLGNNPSKVPAQMQPVPVQYLQMDDEIINVSINGSQNQQQVVPHRGSSTAEVSKQHLSPKDNFSQSNQHDAKHHFTLSSICFPDSMLLADERNILSNVDDILAATAAACGVTPQDFVKATSSEGEMPSIANPSDSKCHFQSAENRHESPSFSSQHSIIANTQTMTFTLNGAHGGHQAFTLSNSHTPQGVSTAIINSQQEMGDRVASTLRKPGDIHLDTEGKNEALPKGPIVNASNGAIPNPNGSSISHNQAHSDFHLAGQEYNPVGLVNRGNLSKSKNQSKGIKGIKMEDGLMDCPVDGLPKKKARSKGSIKPVGEDENGQPKPQKRSSQAKRQNSRGSETSSPSTSEGCHDGYQQQERMRQKIREVEEKQPEVKTGFIGSFLDFLKSGPKQNFSSPPIRTPNRSRKPSASSKRSPCPLPLSCKLQPPSAPLISPDPHCVSSTKRLDEELQKNLETLPSFSSDDDESVGKNQDLQKSISSALSALDEPSDKKHKSDSRLTGGIVKQEQSPSTQITVVKTQEQHKAASREPSAAELLKDVPPDQLAVQLVTVAIEGLTDEELSDSGGEGMYRERDEFVVKNEDIESLKMTMKAGLEPPAIWKVQKALLQKFVPEMRDGRRVFSATNSYLGYFGDAKTMYRRVYVKFLDTVNKREYVRVCNRKPRCKPMHSMRGSQAKTLLPHRAAATISDTAALKPASSKPLSKPRPKQSKAKTEPPPKKRKKWKEFSTSPSESSPEAVSEDDEFTPPVPFASRFLNTRTMKETFKSFVELLISVALDAEVMSALEKENDELLLPHMKRVDGMITDNRRRLLPKLRMGQLFKSALDSFPELSVVTELKKDGETPAFKVRLSGKAYNRKTMKPSKSPSKLPLEYTVDQQKTHWFSLYHSLQHYKYHTYLMCKEEIASLGCGIADRGHEELVQTCMGNSAWVESLFDRFGELLTQVQQACL